LKNTDDFGLSVMAALCAAITERPKSSLAKPYFLFSTLPSHPARFFYVELVQKF
jgi:hypothetical protein